MVLGILLCCLAGLLPAVMLYFPNIEEIPLTVMLPYFGIMAGLGVLAWAVMYLVTRRKGLAAAAAAVWLLVLLNAGRLVPVIQEKFPLAGFKVFAPAALVILLAATFGLSRLKEEFLNDAVKVAVLALAAFTVATAVPALFRAPGEPAEEPVPAVQVDLAPAEGTDRPNIWWILTDEYAGTDELEKYYHYDNSPFHDALREMGFTVSEHSYNWYPDTLTILWDILNLQFTPSSGSTTEKTEALADRNLPMWTVLRELGYEVCEAESANMFRLDNLLEDEVTDTAPRTADGDSVASLLLQYSLLYRYEEEILQAVAPSLAEARTVGAVLDVFEWAEDPENVKSGSPRFTMVYVKSPHAPFVFDRDGNKVPYDKQKIVKDKQYYLDQLVFVTKRLKKICANITENDPDAIVVLQSDHGHRFVDNVTWLDMTNVLNAVYFRGKPLEGIEGRNALNTWLTVLREQFNLDLPEAEEKRMPNEYREQTRDPETEDPNKGLIP